jgi:nicotinamidase-related amidase
LQEAVVGGGKIKMIRPIRLRRKRVIIDIDTQKDLFLANGAFCVRNHRRVLMNIRRTLAWARVKHLRVISTSICKPGKNGDSFHTAGRQKLSYTLRNRKIEFSADNNTDLARDIFTHYDQIILNKRCDDPFDEPRAERLFTELHADELVVIGGLAEGAVVATVLGLLQRGKRVTVLIDAVGTHDRQQADIAFRKMKAKGANLAETRDYAGSTHLKGTGACDCKLCKLEEKRFKASSIGA